MALSDIDRLLDSSELIRRVFTEVLKRRSMLFKDILDRVGIPGGDPGARARVKGALTKLKEADLIDKRPSPIEDFSSYFVTADGLDVERRLR